MKSRLLVLLLVLGVLSATVGEAVAEQRYVVRPGDTLGSIAETFYGDRSMSYLISGANRSVLQGEENVVAPGIELVIPALDLETAPTYGIAQGERDESSGRLMINLIAAANYPPLSGEDLPNGGLATEIVTAVFNKLGYKPTIDFATLAPEPNAAKLGTFAATFPYLGTDHLGRRFLVSDPIVPTRSYIFRHKDSDLGGNVADLNGRRVCMAKSLYPALAKGPLKDVAADVMLTEKPIDCFIAVMRKEANATVAGELEAGTAIASLDIGKDIRISESPIHVGGFSVLFPKLSAHGRVLNYHFNDAMEKMQRSGELDRIIESHLKLGTQLASGAQASDFFAVHLSTLDSKESALAVWRELQQSFPGLLAPMEPIVQRVDFGPGRVLHRLFAWPLSSRASADTACVEFGAKGQYCLAVPAHEIAVTEGPVESGGFAVVLAAFGTRAEAERYLSWAEETMSDDLGGLGFRAYAADEAAGGKYRVITEPLPNEAMARELCVQIGWPFCQVVQR